MVKLFKLADRYAILKYQPSFRSNSAVKLTDVEGGHAEDNELAAAEEACGYLRAAVIAGKALPDRELLCVLFDLQDRIHALDGLGEDFPSNLVSRDKRVAQADRAGSVE